MGIAVDFMGRPFFDSRNDKIRCFKFHVGNPHGQYIVCSKKLFSEIILETMAVFTMDGFIKVIFHLLSVLWVFATLF